MKRFNTPPSNWNVLQKKKKKKKERGARIIFAGRSSQFARKVNANFPENSTEKSRPSEDKEPVDSLSSPEVLINYKRENEEWTKKYGATQMPAMKIWEMIHVIAFSIHFSSDNVTDLREGEIFVISPEMRIVRLSARRISPGAPEFSAKRETKHLGNGGASSIKRPASFSVQTQSPS